MAKPAESKPAEAPKLTEAAAPAAGATSLRRPPSLRTLPSRPLCLRDRRRDRLAGEDHPLELVHRRNRRRADGDGGPVQPEPEGRRRREPVPGQLQGHRPEADGRAPGEAAPDISVLSDVWWFKFYLNKAIIPLDDLLKANNIDKGDYVDAFVNEGTRKNRSSGCRSPAARRCSTTTRTPGRKPACRTVGPETYMELQSGARSWSRRTAAATSAATAWRIRSGRLHRVVVPERGLGLGRLLLRP